MAVQSSSSLFTRLAFSGIRRNRGTYAPYLIACVMAVMMFYTIVSLGDNPTLRSMGGGTNMIIILNFGTWILALFSLIFLFYTNSFLIKRRKKEFGLFTILGMFLTMAMMTLRIWELYELALPLIIILLLQTLALALFAIFVLFRALGKDYDAVVMVAGLMGHGLGATPNAVANMGAVCERYGVMSHKAFLIVPLCGAVLIDLVGIPNIVWFINYLTK